MIERIIVSLALALLCCISTQANSDLEREFATPPEGTKPRCYYYWISGQVTREGITHDLEAMRKAGIGEAYIGIINGGEVKALSEPWWGMIEHAIREGGRIGVDIGLFNCPGWSQSGGPWVKPEQAMRYIVAPELRLTGPQRFEGKLPLPEQTTEPAFQDIALLAFPAPQGDGETLRQDALKLSSAPEVSEIAQLFDGDMTTTRTLEGGTQITAEATAPFIARSLTISPTKTLNAKCELLVSDDGETFRSVRSFALDRHNLMLGVGPVPLAPITVTLPETKAKFFRLTFSQPCTLGEIAISGAARIDSISEKAMTKMWQDPTLHYDSYLWPDQPEQGNPALVLDPKQIQNLSAKLGADGTLSWDVPAGEWVIQRVGMTPTGTRNSPAPPEATGLEVDKMNREALAAHFDAYIGELLRRMPAGERKALKHIVADSYEMGPQNWTDELAQDFEKRYDYDPLPFLPVMSGRIVQSVDHSERFLWDLRRMVADRVSHDYVGALRALCNANGLKLWLENYGHWGFPGEFLQYGGQSDELGGEYWVGGGLGKVEVRCATSACHIYGKRQVFAESFTGGPLFTSHPGSLKAQGDWAYAEGINQPVFHVYIHQPWDDKRPGVSEWFGTEFNRHNTWFGSMDAYTDYLRRCSVLLQAGNYVADVAYFIGEDTPKMTGKIEPALPAGYSYDFINAEVIERDLQVKDGRFVLPHGMSYRVLALPQSETMRPELLEKLTELVKAGGTVLLTGDLPQRSPSLEGFPKSDARVKELAEGMWSETNGAGYTQHEKGRAYRNVGLESVFEAAELTADLSGVDHEKVLFIHRQTEDADIYFLSNQQAQAVSLTPTFRVTGLAPELWDPLTGQRSMPAVYDFDKQGTTIPIQLAPSGSIFVVFRKAVSNQRITNVTHDGAPLFSTTPVKLEKAPTTAQAGTFTLAFWVKPTAQTALPAESNVGADAIASKGNEAIPAQHGGSIASGGGHAGVGVSVGTNGVSVFEHGADYFAPVLVHGAAITQWTHIALVYQEGTPTLYLNGKAVHTGLKSARTPIPSVAPGDRSGFGGELKGYKQLSTALNAEQVATLQTAMQEQDETPAGEPLELSFNDEGELIFSAGVPGMYILQTANAQFPATYYVPGFAQELELSGAWQVSFPADSGVAGSVAFEELDSWTNHANPLIKYFSGTAVYRRSFDLAELEADKAAGREVFLDLGDVDSLAGVTLNGVELGTLWTAPFRVNITEAAKATGNALEIRVTNVWHNRLVGAAAEPAAFKQAGVFQPSVIGGPEVDAKAPLLRSGLIGPVRIVTRARLKGEALLNQTYDPSNGTTSEGVVIRQHL